MTKKSFVNNHTEFTVLWHEELKKLKGLEEFNHKKGFKDFPQKNMHTLEIGAATGNHTMTEDLQLQEYEIVEIDSRLCELLQKKFPKIKVHNDDICTFKNDILYDRIIAVHVLEHIKELGLALNNMYALLKREGYVDVVIPCEGGLVYSIGRELTAKRKYEKKFKTPYKDYIKHEHVQTANDILDAIRLTQFKITWMKFYPFNIIPVIDLNGCIGLRLQK